MASQAALQLAGELFDFDPGTLSLIRIWEGSPNHIYAFARAGTAYILRIAPDRPGWADRTRAEMDFLDYLARGGARVSLPLASVNGALVEAVRADGEPLVMCAFERADGLPCDSKSPATWNERTWRSWGGAMGAMHRLTKDYAPRGPWRRPAFSGHDVLLDGISRDPMIERIMRPHVARLLALPKDRDGYGLIHQDMHQHNFFVDGGIVRAFDFDDSLYGHFALDIGIALFHALAWGLPDESSLRPEAAGRVMTAFLQGYLTENELETSWLAEIPAFMRYRQMSDLAFAMSEGEADPAELDRMRRGVVIEGVALPPEWFAAQKIHQILPAGPLTPSGRAR